MSHELQGSVGPRGAKRLTAAIIAWRVGHGAIAVVFLASIAYIWWCAITGRRDRLLGLAAGSLVAEGAVVAANHGDCPLGPVGERVGDPAPLFELVLPPQAARRAIPVLGAVAAVGFALVAIRRPEA